MPAHEPLSEVQWNFLVARCRDVKERCLSDSSSNCVHGICSGSRIKPAREHPGRSDRPYRDRVNRVGRFFSRMRLDDKPAQTQAGLREWALPYAADSAVTRYLAEFLRDRPIVDAILFNGGSLYPEALRQRLQKQIALWQHGVEPRLLENPEPSLAVARGAAHFGSIVLRHAQRIEAGAARAIYLEVHKRDVREGIGRALCIDLYFAWRRSVRRKIPGFSKRVSNFASIVRSGFGPTIQPGAQGTKQGPWCPGTIATFTVSRRSRRPLGLPGLIVRATGYR